MSKKNTRKRLLAGALATVMMLTMCPSWALADDEDIALLPANEEIAVPVDDSTSTVVDSTPAADPTETPTDSTPSEAEAKPAEVQNTAPAPSDDGANGGTDSTESGNSTNSTVSEGSENNSQNDNAASNTPENEIASQFDYGPGGNGGRPVDSSVTEIDAEYWITNAMAKDSSGNWTLEINAQTKDIMDDDGVAVEDLAPEIRENIGDYETTVFGHARVLSNREHQEQWQTDRSLSGTEINAIRYSDNKLQYRAKDPSHWTDFESNDQLVFYYLVRTDYSKMVQIDVSDWTVEDEPSYAERRSVTYQVIVDGGEDNGKVLDSKKFWYNKTFTVSSVRVRQTESENYTINRVELDPSTLGTVNKDDLTKDYQFSLDLSKADCDEATVKIYVSPNVQLHQLTYVLNDGKITSKDNEYTKAGLVYPDAPVITPAAEKDNCDFDGWYTDAELTKKWIGKTMPNDNLTLYACFTPKQAPNPNPENQKAMYFVLLPNRGVPTSGESQGTANYLPNDTSDGGVKGAIRATGYAGYLTEAGKKVADNGGTFSANGVDSSYLIVPTDLGFFTKSNWNGTTYPTDKTDTSAANIKTLLGEKFNPQIAEVVWYTVKYDATDGYHVDGYVKNVDVNVTYHSHFGDDAADVYTATTGTEYSARKYEDTQLPTRENYTFGGWYTNKDCTTGKEYQTTTLMTSLDLYAKWIPAKFDVSYFIDGTQDGKTEKHDVDSTVTVKAASTKEGHTFVGWTPADDVTSIINVVDGKFTMPTQSVRFNGTFVVNKYNVIYKVDNKEVGTDEYNFNSDVTVRSIPTKEGYTFVGWNSDDAAFNSNGFKMPAHDVIIKGEFVKTDFNVIYKVDGEEYAKDSYKVGDDVVIRDVPTKEGHTFSGWKIGNDDADDFTMPANDVTIEGTFTINSYTVTYYLGNEQYGETETYKYGDPVTIRDDVQKDGWAFTGWNSDDAVFNSDGFKMPARNIEIRGSHTQNKHQYTIVKHFYDEKGTEIETLGSKETKTGAENALIDGLYRADAADQTVDGKTYVYVSSLTTVDPAIKNLTEDVTINLHYYLDAKGDKEKPEENGNGTPDAWEYRVTFKVVNGEWNNGGSADVIVYVRATDDKGVKLENVTLDKDAIPAIGEKPSTGFHAGAWDKTPVGGDKVENDTVFTYTYEKDSSSSGGGHHRRNDTVTIPDEVPTGLNGDDHYAYIVGYPDSTVRPQNGITRAEVATIFFRLLTDETRDANSTKSNSYSDVASNAWYNHAVSTLSAMGIIKGSNGKFNPNAPITRAEFAAIAARFDDNANTTTADFSDIASHWAKNEISAASNNGWIYGYTDGTFRPDNHITRAEAMTLVNRVLKRLPETEEDLHDDMIKWSDNSDASQWFYLAVQEATNSHYYETKENEYEKWSELRETRDWTELEK